VAGEATLQFIYRDGCHLCEEMAAFLYRHYPRLFSEMSWIAVDSDAGLQRQFGSLVPVLRSGEEVLCALRVDHQRLESYFGPPANPV